MKPSVVRIRVRYPEVDRMDVVHHSHYPVWFEMGRTELMRDLGVPYAALEADKLFMPVVDLAVRYLAPVRYDEEVEVRTVIEEVGGARVRFGYRLMAGSGERCAAEGHTVHAAVNERGSPVRLPAELRRILESAAGEGTRSR